MTVGLLIPAQCFCIHSFGPGKKLSGRSRSPLGSREGAPLRGCKALLSSGAASPGGGPGQTICKVERRSLSR